MLQRYAVRLRIYSWFMKYCHSKLASAGVISGDVGRRQHMPMGIQGVSGPVGCSDPCIKERVDHARPSRGALGPVEFFNPSLRDSRSHGQVRDPQPRKIHCGECILPRECRMVLSWLGSHGCGLCLSRLAPGLQPEWVQVYNPCRVNTIHIAAYSVMYIPTFLLLHLE